MKNIRVKEYYPRFADRLARDLPDKARLYQQLKPLPDVYATQLTRAVNAARSSRQLARSLTN